MAPTQGTFQRYEKKYLLSELQYRQIKAAWKDKFEIDQYKETTICNIYFDTPSHLLIRNSLEKPIYKEKLRLRSYGTPSEGDTVFVELKKKYKGVVYKRRVKMELSQAEKFLYEREKIESSTQIVKEIDYFLDFYKELIPSMYISYDRTAYYGLDNPDLRITFDTNVRYREEKLWLEAGVWGDRLLEDGTKLMEIKIPGAMPVWLSNTLTDLNIYPTSFSKYGRAYEISLKKPKTIIKEGEIKYA